MLDTTIDRQAWSASKPARIFIDGDSGTTGLQIRERLSKLADIEQLSIDAALRKDVAAKRDILAKVDLAILCLPDAAAKESAALADRLGNAAPKLSPSGSRSLASSWAHLRPRFSRAAT